MNSGGFNGGGDGGAGEFGGAGGGGASEVNKIEIQLPTRNTRPTVVS